MTISDARHPVPDEASLDTAADWFLRLKEMPDDPQLRADFTAWLARDDSSRAAWVQICESWRLMGEVVPVHEDLWRSAPSNVILLRPRLSLGRIWGRAAVAASVAAMIAWFTLPGLLLQLEADHLTQTAELRDVLLEDGTRVTLGGKSAIAVDFDGKARHVRLLSGEAFFDVAHDPDRPFLVLAGGVEAKVLGTKFDVQLTAGATRVDLAEGALQLTTPGGPVLSPGESATVRHDTGAFTLQEMAPEDIAAWREGRIFVADAPISEVIEQLRRYHPGWINIVDSTLGTRRVTGLYDLRDPDRALRALVQPHGGTVRQVSPWVVMVSRW